MFVYLLKLLTPLILLSWRLEPSRTEPHHRIELNPRPSVPLPAVKLTYSRLRSALEAVKEPNLIHGSGSRETLIARTSTPITRSAAASAHAQKQLRRWAEFLRQRHRGWNGHWSCKIKNIQVFIYNINSILSVYFLLIIFFFFCLFIHVLLCFWLWVWVSVYLWEKEPELWFAVFSCYCLSRWFLIFSFVSYFG